MNRLELYVRGWREAAADLRDVATPLSADEWQAATDCPGWSVQDVLAHVVAVEEYLAGIGIAAGAPVETAVVTPEWTEVGVAARRGRAPADLLSDLDAVLATREAQLAHELPGVDPEGRPPRVPAGLDWDWETLLRNRAIDVWVHGQDIRRAVGRRGGLDNTAAAVTLGTFTQALPFVIGRRVRPAVGTSVVWEITGEQPATVAVQVDPRRRAVPLPDAPAEPTTRLVMDAETFAALGAGRWTPAAAPVQVSGDADLAASVMAAMALTP